MEIIENLMVMPEYEYKSKRIPDDIWSEMEDRDYDDMVFDEITKE